MLREYRGEQFLKKTRTRKYKTHSYDRDNVMINM